MRKLTICLGVLMLVAPLFLITSTSLAGRKPKPPPEPADADPALCYTTDGGGKKPGKLWVADADGANATAILEVQGIWQPEWSPDGTKIAYVGGIADYIYTVGVEVVDGVPVAGTPTLIYDGIDDGVDAPRWSPGGDEILFAAWTSPKRLVVIPAEGGTTTTLHTGYVSYATWSPDGSEVAFVEGTSAGEYIKVLDRSTKVVTATYGPLGLRPVNLDWARTKRVIAFDAFVDGTRGIYTLDLASSTIDSVVEGRCPTWSPDDEKLAFVDGSVFEYDFATGDTSRLVRTLAQFVDWRR